jgi:hypothetical protein
MAVLYENHEELHEFNQYLVFEPKEIYRVQPENPNNKYAVNLMPGQRRMIVIKALPWEGGGEMDTQFLCNSINLNIKVCMKAVYERCIQYGDHHKLGHSQVFARKLMHPQGVVYVYCN